MKKSIEGSPESQMRSSIIVMMLERRNELYTKKDELPRNRIFDREAEDIQVHIDEIDILIDFARDVEIN